MDTVPRITWPTRLARWLGLDHNPLRRRTDRAEAWLVSALIAAFLVGAPLATVTASQLQYAAGTRALRAQQAWHHVPATLTQDASGAGSFVYGSAETEWVRARWTAPSGAQRTGDIPVPVGKQAGSTVQIWVDRSGELATRTTHEQITDRMVAVAVFTPIAASIVLLTLLALVHRIIQRRRLRHWEKAWASIEPQWSRRRI